MTQAEVKAQLYAATAAYRKYRLAADIEQSYYAQLTGTGIRYDRNCISSGDGENNHVESTLIQLITYGEKKDEARREWMTARVRLHELVERITDDQQKQVIIYRFLNDDRFPEIARKMNTSERQIYRIYKSAVKYLCRIL